MQRSSDRLATESVEEVVREMLHGIALWNLL